MIVIIFGTSCRRWCWVRFGIHLCHLILLSLACILHHHHLWRVYDWPLRHVILEVVRRRAFHSLSLYVLVVKPYRHHSTLLFFFFISAIWDVHFFYDSVGLSCFLIGNQSLLWERHQVFGALGMWIESELEVRWGLRPRVQSRLRLWELHLP